MATLLLAAAGIGVGATPRPHRAGLSHDLFAHQQKKSTARVRVIVRGSAEQIESLARRHRVTVVRLLDGGAVLRANSDELTRLSAAAACSASDRLPA
jgi:hypothetical protein